MPCSWRWALSAASGWTSPEKESCAASCRPPRSSRTSTSEADTRLAGDVAVVGGGSTAMDAARSALRAGAQHRPRPVSPHPRGDARPSRGGPGRTRRGRPAPRARRSRRDPRRGRNGAGRTLPAHSSWANPTKRGDAARCALPGTEFDLPAGSVLVAVGEAPDPSFLPEGTSVGVAPWGGLLINPRTLATGATGVFAAGDVTYGPRSVIQAAAHGRQAARSIHAYLRSVPPQRIAELPEDEFQTPSTLPPGGRFTLDLRPAAERSMPLRGVGRCARPVGRVRPWPDRGAGAARGRPMPALRSVLPVSRHHRDRQRGGRRDVTWSARLFVTFTFGKGVLPVSVSDLTNSHHLRNQRRLGAVPGRNHRRRPSDPLGRDSGTVSSVVRTSWR